MTAIIFREKDAWLDRRQPWVRLASFLVTVLLATRQQWSAQDLAWSFWLAGLTWGSIYILVNQAAESMRRWKGSDRTPVARIANAVGALVGTYFVFLFAYLLFAGFLDTVFTFAALDTGSAEIAPFFASLPASLSHALTNRWSFLMTSGISLLPGYVKDAITVEFSDFTKAVFAKDLLRMIVLIFILVPLTMLRLGVFALFPILFVYFLPLTSIRQIFSQIREHRKEAI